VHCGRTVVAEEGVRALWKGLTPFATHLTLKYALRMGSNSVYQGLLRDRDGKLSDGRRMAAGFAAGITEALLIVTPFEVVKIRLQQQKGCAREGLKYRGPVHCALTVIREEGPLGLWAGAAPTMVRNGTNQLCLFWAKHRADALLWGKHEGDGVQLTPLQSMASGFSAACLGPVATGALRGVFGGGGQVVLSCVLLWCRGGNLCAPNKNQPPNKQKPPPKTKNHAIKTGPFDVVKTRLMAQGKAPPGTQPRYSGLLDALVKIPRQEGIGALYKGLLPRLMRIPPGQAIVWAVSDQICGYVERHGWGGA
jgi:solute carrier family 25 citrate transporter 1